jgi:multidrug efflux pump subunit AcrB
MVGFFIERPIFASAIAIIMLLAGSICYFLLPVSQFPEITPPQVVVSAIYPGDRLEQWARQGQLF